MNIKRTVALAIATSTAALGCMSSLLPGAQAGALPQHAAATKVTTANLPAASQIKFYADSPVRTMSTFRGFDDGGTGLCVTRDWQSFRPNAEFGRIYRIGDPSAASIASASVASFATHETAVKDAATMAASLNCKAGVQLLGGIDMRDVEVTRSATTLPGGQRVFLTHLSYPDAQDNFRHDEQVGIVATGTHVELVDLNYSTQDYDNTFALKTIKASLPTLAR